MSCRVCGTELPEGALFCGECGSAVTAPPLVREEVADRRPADTSIVRPARREEARPESGATSPPEAGDPAGAPEPALHPAPAPHPVPVAADPVPAPPDPVPAAPKLPPVPPASPEAPFVLRFASGRREPVRGSGLLGRRPVAQPAEVFDQYVTVDDPERTVSKTHLQFGIEGDEFWVCDRFSANGTIVVAPGGDARPCEPGRRYRAPRGSRVEIGESHFDVE